MITINEIIKDLESISKNMEKEIECSSEKCGKCNYCIFSDIDNVIDELLTIKSHIKEVI